MKNSYENNVGSSNYEKTEAKIKELEKAKEKLDFPLGKSDNFERDGSTIVRTIGNSFLSIPNIPEIKLKEIQIYLNKKKLEYTYNKDEKEAYKLNDKYNALAEEAITTGDSTKLKEFAIKELGMNME